MKPNTPLYPGQVVQLHPEKTHNKAFAACLFVITEPKVFGAMGYVQALGETREEPGGQAYYRAQWEEMDLLEPGNLAPWVLAQHAPERGWMGDRGTSGPFGPVD